MDLYYRVIVFIVSLLLSVVREGSCQTSVAVQDKVVIDVVVILPKDNKFKFSLARIEPGIRIAVESDRIKELVPNIEFNVQSFDSGCDLKTAPLMAIDNMINKTVDIFFGPFCDYAVAPVARYAHHWKKHIITAGASAPAFGNKRDYFMTRINIVHQKVGRNLAHIMTDYLGWTRHAYVYRYDPRDMMEKDCFFVTNGFHFEYMTRINNFEDIEYGYFKDDTHDFKADLEKNIKTKSRGKVFTM